MEDIFRKRNSESGVDSTILAESGRYKITNEYETVYLEDKMNHRKIVIGDFYGDPDGAVIDRNERFAVVYGCGVIVYFLHSPFTEYAYSARTEQWLECGREDPVMWVNEAIQTDDHTIRLFLENGEEYVITLHKKC